MATPLIEHVNGRQRGRAVPELPMHTFKDSGITVRLRKLSPVARDDVIAGVSRDLADTKPQPPIVEVDYGQGKIKEPHTGDPTYIRHLQEWQAGVSSEANARLFKLACLDAVEVEIGDSERALIARKQRYMRIAGKVEWQPDPNLHPEENDQWFYIAYVACASLEDIKEFYEAVLTRSQPTEAAIEQHKASFPSDV